MFLPLFHPVIPASDTESAHFFLFHKKAQHDSAPAQCSQLLRAEASLVLRFP